MEGLQSLVGGDGRYSSREAVSLLRVDARRIVSGPGSLTEKNNQVEH